MKVGFIGTGVMGSSMIKHLLAQHQVYIYTRTKSKAQEVLDKGAIWVSTPSELNDHCEVVITMVGYPTDLEAVYFGENGLFSNAKAGSIFIDCTTSTPTLAKSLYEFGKEKGVDCLDAPVSGGDIGARNATLTIMCGGDQEVFDKVKPLLALMGNNIILQGGAGAGQHTKMSNQIAIATNMIGVCEAIIYAEKAGLDVNRVLDSISTGAAGSASLNNYAHRILKGDFEPGFYIKHFIKDMRIALEEAVKLNLSLPGLELSLKLYEEVAALGFENKGTQALMAWYASQEA